MKWRFEDILAFVTVVEARSVTSAATRMNISKSVISKRISDLETALHVELFHRSTGSVKANRACMVHCTSGLFHWSRRSTKRLKGFPSAPTG